MCFHPGQRWGTLPGGSVRCISGLQQDSGISPGTACGVAITPVPPPLREPVSHRTLNNKLLFGSPQLEATLVFTAKDADWQNLIFQIVWLWDRHVASLPEAGAVVTVDHVRGRGRHNPALGRHRARECGLNFSSQQLLLFASGLSLGQAGGVRDFMPPGNSRQPVADRSWWKSAPASSPTSQGSYEALSCSPVRTSPGHWPNLPLTGFLLWVRLLFLQVAWDHFPLNCSLSNSHPLTSESPRI